MQAACIVFTLAALLPTAAGEFQEVRWVFEDVEVGELPEGWSAEKTGKGPGSVWKVVQDATAPNGANALAQTSSAGPRPLFNLCVLNEVEHADVEISVSFKAVEGKIDRGGGPVWRYQDANNYYICRQNPLEDNFRVYKVIEGKRTQLASIESTAEAGKWHTIKVAMRGDEISCSVDGKKLEVKDKAITKSGKVGLWTKADAVTYFDDLHVRKLGD